MSSRSLLVLLCSIIFFYSLSSAVIVDGVLTDWPGHSNCTIGAENCALRGRSNRLASITNKRTDAAAAWMLLEDGLAYGRFDVYEAPIQVVSATNPESFITFCLQNATLGNAAGVDVTSCGPLGKTHWMVLLKLNQANNQPYCMQFDCVNRGYTCDDQYIDDASNFAALAAGDAVLCNVATSDSVGVEFSFNLTGFQTPIPNQDALSALRVYVYLDNSGGSPDDFISTFTWPLKLLPISDIWGIVWNDNNVDGVRQAGEAVVPGIPVQLFDVNNTLVATTVTESNGFYLFRDQINGTYSVRFAIPDGFAYTLPLQGADNTSRSLVTNVNGLLGITAPFLLPFRVNATWINAGIYRLGSIGDFVWRDADDDGIQDVGEQGVPSVTVRLLNATADAVLGTTTTNSTGFYHFGNLIAGSYSVEFEIDNTAFRFGRSLQGSNNATDSNAIPLSATVARTDAVTILDNSQVNTIDAGLVPLACIGQRVWRDSNYDGLLTGGENGVSNIVVELLRNTTNNTVEVVATATTNSTGFYRFCQLPNAQYRVRFVIPETTLFTRPTVGGSVAVPLADPTIGQGPWFDLLPGIDLLTQNAGLLFFSSLGDYIWIDQNNNGQQDGGEPGYDGVATVRLYNSTDTSLSTPLATTESVNGTGAYLFSRVIPGSYIVAFEVDTLRYAFSQFRVQSSNNLLDSDVNSIGVTPTIVVPPESAVLTVDAGLVPRLCVGRRVWLDIDADGVYEEATESGAPNIVVALLNSTLHVLQTTQTNAVGLYSICNVLPGEYTIEFRLNPVAFAFSPPLQQADTTVDSDVQFPLTGRTSPFNVPAAGNLYTDAGIYPYTNVGDFVWNDVNGNGYQDSGEAGVENITVVLLRFDQQQNALVPLATTTTNSAGAYRFTNLSPATYAVQFQVNPLRWAFTTFGVDGGSAPFLDSDVNQAATGLTPSFFLVAGLDRIDIDAGLVDSFGSIGNFVWFDLNLDGLQTQDEPGVSNVVVELLRNGTQVVQTTTTSATGFYLFPNVVAGTYAVRFVNPDTSLYYFTTPLVVSGNATDDSNAAANGVTAQFDLATLTSDLTIDAGLVPFSCVGDFVWFDLNGDGEQQFGEQGARDVNVVLRLNNANGAVVQSAQTNATGYYRFCQVVPGNTYVVQFSVDPDRFTFSPASRTDESLDSDVVDVSPLGVGTTEPFLLAPNSQRMTEDAGIVPWASLGDYVWDDANGDGLQQGTESGIFNVTVLLRNQFDNSTLRATRTNEQGRYLFDRLLAGSYIVQFVIDYDQYLPSPALRDFPSSFEVDSDIVEPLTGKTGTVSLSTGDQLDTIDAGLMRYSVLGDYVWVDLNSDGVQQSEESGVPDVFVYLRRLPDQTTVNVTQTDANGRYIFDRVTPGLYQLQFGINQTFFAFTSPNVPDGNNTVDSDVIDGVNGLTGPIPVVTGTNNRNLDAGVIPLSCIGELVWLDFDGNGLRAANETGVSDITVILRNEFDNRTLAVTVTDANGFYRFCRLLNGNYRVQFVIDPLEYMYTQPEVGPDAGLRSSVISWNGAGVGSTRLITLSNPGEFLNTINAGIHPYSSIGDRVWLDTPGDGVQRTDSVGLFGITVVLRNGFDNSTVAITETDANGYYHFEMLAPGDYFVRFVIDYSKYAFSPANAASANNSVDSDVQVPNTGLTAKITLPASTNIDTVDAGVVPLSCIGDRVWHDLDGDGEQEIDEPGLSNVVVMLRNADDNRTLAMTVTDVDGKYQFCSLLKDTYRVRFRLLGPDWTFAAPSIPNGNQATDSDAVPIPSSVFGTTVPLAIENGVTRNDIDAGMYLFGSLGDFVWLDQNGDGAQQTSEAGIPNVPVRLVDDATNVVLATTFTNPQGYYLFTQVRPGAYRVVFQIDPATGSFSDSSNVFNTTINSDVVNFNSLNGTGSTAPFVLAAQESRTDIDAGVSPYLTIGDYVWNDRNVNGLQDNNEIGVSGVTVTLLNANNVAVRVTTTDASGRYVFSNLNRNFYRVQFTLPNNNYYFSPNIGDFFDVNSDVTNSTGLQGITDLFQLTASRSDIDAGLAVFNSIGDFVWEDANSDGRQDDDESGVPNVPVVLYKQVSGQAQEIAQTTTNADGRYLFERLPLGTYSIRVTIDTTRYRFTSANKFTESVDSDITTVVGANGFSDLFPLNFDNTQLRVLDAGLGFVSGQIGDYVWADVDGDSIQDNNETGVPDVVVRLFSTATADYSDPNAVPVRIAVTDAAGGYLFNNVDPGTYWLQFVADMDAYAFSPVIANGETVVVDPLTGRSAPITLTPGQSNLGQDAGLRPYSMVSGLVWEESGAADGQRQSNESVVPNVFVVLSQPGTPLLRQTSTDASGRYNFTQLPVGTYFVAFLPLVQYTFTNALVGDAATNSDVDNSNGQGTTASFPLNVGEHRRNIDAGLVRINVPPTPSRPSAISGIAWFDGDCVNSDGVYYRDRPAAGVMVSLFNAATDALVAETMTNENGRYVFADIPANTNYYVQFQKIAGHDFVPPHVFSVLSDVDSDVVDLNAGTTEPFFVGSYVNVVHKSDAGYQFSCEKTPDCAECEDLTDIFCELNQEHLAEYRRVAK